VELAAQADADRPMVADARSLVGEIAAAIVAAAIKVVVLSAE
jgi:hypothetical protein